MPKALVVDDSKAMRMIVGRTLCELGFEIHEAADGLAALQALETAGPIDLTMVDWNMPEMDGLELLKKIRAERRYDAVKVVMVTTENGIPEMVTALAAGADEYVMKPFTKEILTEKLRMAAVPV